MINIQLNQYLKPVLLIICCTIFATSTMASEKTSGHHNLTTKKHKLKRPDTKWPDKKGEAAWDDEEFESDGSCSEPNIEKEIIVDFEYLLNCIN